MGFKPKQKEMGQGGGVADPDVPKFDFVTPEPEEGLQAATVSVIVSLGTQKRPPYTKTDDKGNDVMGEDGNPIIISPKPNEQVAMYVDLNENVWDFGGEIGEKQIRLPVHEEFAGQIKEGINFKEQGHFTADHQYIKGKPWTLPPSSKFAKIAKVCGAPEIMESGGYGDGNEFGEINESKSDISLLMGKPFLYNVEVKKVNKVKDGKPVTYVNVNLRTPVPLMKGMVVSPLTAEPICISFSSDVDELLKLVPLLRSAVRKKIQLALDYVNINYDDENAEPTPSNMKIAFDQLGVNSYGNIVSGGSPAQGDAPQEDTPVPKAKPKAPAKAAPKKAAPVQQPEDDPDDQPPF